MKTTYRVTRRILFAVATFSLTGCLSLDDYVHYHEVTPPTNPTPQRPQGGSTEVDPPPEGETQQPGGSQGVEPGSGEEDDPIFNPGGISTVEKFDVTLVTPAKGNVDGGYTIQVQGKLFDGETTVQFGSTQSPKTSLMSRYVLRTLVPSGHKGCVDVTVTNGTGEQKTLEKAFCYTEELSVTSVEPTRAVEHEVTPIIIRGEGFDDTMSFYAQSGDETRRLLDTVIHSDTVEAILPDIPAGSVDILISTPTGHAVKMNALTLLPQLVAQDVSPRVIRAGQKTSLSVTGKGFSASTPSVLVGSSSASASVSSDTTLSASVALPAPGCYDLVLYDDLRQSRIDQGIYAVGDTEEPAVYAILPNAAPLEGGMATLAVSHLPADTAIYIGGQSAEIVSQTDDAWEIMIPAVSTPQTVSITAGDITLDDAFSYYAVPRFTSVVPAQGHAGDTVVLTGKNLNDTLRVFADQFEATSVTIDSPTQATIVMPEGSGTARLTAIQDGITSDTRLTFQYVDAPSIYGVTPAQIPVIGGSTVSLYGEGFSDALSLYIDGTLISDVGCPSPNLMQFVAPPHEIGDYTLELKDEQGNTIAQTPIKYYEPGGLNTHLSGSRLEGQINVTVLTVNTSEVIPGADVYVGPSADTALMLHGTTNAFGQVSFQSEKLTGPQILYACAQDHSCNTIQSFNAQDVTIYLEDWHAGEGSSSSTTPPPPPPPSDDPTINPIDVTVVKPAEDSFITGKVSGFGKVALESDPNVVRAARVIQSQLGPYTSTVSTDTVLIFDENGTYKIKARRGDIALGLICGLYNTVTGTFDPRYFGVRTGLYVTNGVTLTADLTCPLPLNQTQSIKMLNLPEGQTSRSLNAAAYLNLGNYGYLGGFMTGSSDTDLVVITRVPPLRGSLAEATLALQTSLYVDNAYRGTIYSYDIDKNDTTIEVGPIVSLPVFDRLPDENYYVTATNTVLHNGEAFLRRGILTWHTPRPEYVDFYAVTIRGYYPSYSDPQLLWQFYLPGNATSIEFPQRDYTFNNELPHYIYVTLTAYKSIFAAYDFNAFSTLDTKSAYVDSSASTSLYLPWETYGSQN